MTDVFVDSSAIISIGLGEATAVELHEQLTAAYQIAASPLLEAEVRTAFRREGREVAAALLAGIKWIIPSVPLSAEIDRVLDAGYVRGADCWHLAVALYVAPRPRDLTFLTLDAHQRAVAKKLGFRV